LTRLMVRPTLVSIGGWRCRCHCGVNLWVGATRDLAPTVPDHVADSGPRAAQNQGCCTVAGLLGRGGAGFRSLSAASERPPGRAIHATYLTLTSSTLADRNRARSTGRVVRTKEIANSRVLWGRVLRRRSTSVNEFGAHQMEYNPSEDAVLVIVDFPAAVVASAFAMRFGTSISYCRNPHHRTAGSRRRRHLSPSISVLHTRSLMA
jgi:hypothetical protein